MKKIFAGVLLGITLLLAGCGGDETDFGLEAVEYDMSLQQVQRMAGYEGTVVSTMENTLGNVAEIREFSRNQGDYFYKVWFLDEQVTGVQQRRNP